jgi:hypothetical protein
MIGWKVGNKEETKHGLIKLIVTDLLRLSPLMKKVVGKFSYILQILKLDGVTRTR